MENLFNKELTDVSVAINNINWSADGCVSVVSGTDITVFCPSFSYIDCYSPKFVSLACSKKKASKSTSTASP